MRLLAALLFAAAAPAWGQTPAYPTKAVRIVVGFAPGGSTDITARIVAQKLTDLWGQTVVVDNRPGASGMIAAELTAKAAPDGYTLLASPQTSTAVAPSLYPKIAYDPLRDFAPITVVASSPQLLVVHPSLPAKSFKEFVALAKSRPGQLSYGSGGIGSTPHLGGELLSSTVGIKMVHVPYKGENPALADVIGGQLPLMFSNLPVALPYTRSGRLRGLAVTSLQRSPLAPETPTVAESGLPGFETATWTGLYAPAALPRELVLRINGDVIRLLSSAEVKERLAAQGLDLVGNTPEQHAAYLKSETIKWAKVIKDAGVRVE
jgi:tripartite-type tricarboxylate transporter receptor subunit TctC